MGNTKEASVSIAQPDPGDWYLTIQNMMPGGFKDAVLSVSSEYPSDGLTVRTPTLLPPARPGASYSFQFEAAGGAAPYLWYFASGSLPSGLSLSNAGILSGVAAQTVTNYNFTLRVVDSAGKTVYAGFHIEYSNAVPVVNVNVPCPTTASLGLSYSCALSANGGTPPYVWTLENGSLPPGITLSSAGLLSGTPSSQGAFAFQIRARDLGGIEATKALQLDVAGAARAPNWLWDVLGKPGSGTSR
jgi:hypothetical protein